MEREDLEKLAKSLNTFTTNKCTGCDTCQSTKGICLAVTNLQLKINERIKENEYGREHSING